MAFLVGSSTPVLQRLAVPFACILIATLGYGSQILFATSPDLAPGPLTTTETRVFNALLALLWWTYYRACTVDPGRYEFPRSSKKTDGKAVTVSNDKKKDMIHGGEQQDSSSSSDDNSNDDDDEEHSEKSSHPRRTRSKPLQSRRRAKRWCRKCAASKPPRAHHCKTCGRCIPKMDHHCPWTSNCVSLQTFPHFLRFLLYTNLSLWTLHYHLYARWAALYGARHLPAYLGPSLPELCSLAFLSLVGGLAALALGILLFTSTKGWMLNTTLIETWEIERHEAVLRRSGRGDDGDWWREDEDELNGSDRPARMMVEPVEFPYDIGIRENMAAGMGSGNPFEWILPFSGNPRIAKPKTSQESQDGDIETLLSSNTTVARRRLGTGWSYPENGLNDDEGMWPPPDPDKIRNARLWRRRRREYQAAQELAYDPPLPGGGHLSPEEEKEAFRRRQEVDLRRWKGRMIDELEESPPLSHRKYDYNHDFNGREDGLGAISSSGRGGSAPRPRRPSQKIVLDDKGPTSWVNADGEHLGDYGVDEDAEFADDYDEFLDDDNDDNNDDDRIRQAGAVRNGKIRSRPPLVNVDDDDDDDEEVPLAELIRRRKGRKNAAADD